MFAKQVAVGIVLVAASLLGVSWAQLKAGCKLETLTACGDDFLPYGKTTSLAVSGPPLMEKCQIYRDQLDCTKNFTRVCTEGVPRAAVLLAMEAFQDHVDAVCTVGTKSYEDYQRSVGCMNSVGVKINGCLNGLHDDLEKAVVKATPKDTIRYTCCSYGGLVDCLENVLVPCEDVGGREFTINLVEQVFGETLSLVCGTYIRGSEACNALPKLPALGAKDRKYDGFVELLLEIVDRIGGGRG